MKGIRSGEPELFKAFLKSAQYLVRLQTQQDIWEHLGKFVLAHFQAYWVALIERDANNSLSVGYSTMPPAFAAESLLTAEVRTLVADVLESGFLATRVLLTPDPSVTAFLPIGENQQTCRVMLLGHHGIQPLSNELLNIYLALAGLAGSASERKRAEDQVRRMNEDLELRVAERTAQLHVANDELRREIVERKRVEQERETTIEFLRLVNESTGTRGLIRAAITFFQQQSGCQAVGVRLREGTDYPYFEARGFPGEFVLLENSLCARDAAGEVIRDSHGDPLIECMCGNVICGRFDPSKPFFTAGGSFWANSTTRLLATTSEADRQAPTRNRCNDEGYESVALVPLVVGEQRLGLVQLNDRRSGIFTPEDIGLWERLAGHLAIALAKCRAEEALRWAEDRYRRIVENAGEGIWMISTDGSTTYVNPQMAAMLGYDSAEMLGRNAFEFTFPEDYPAGEKDFTERLRNSDRRQLECRYRRKDGSAVWTLINSTILHDDAGRSAGVLRLLTDITAHKQAEQALLRSEKLASVGRMAATIAHEINNPLESVTNSLFLAKKVEDLPKSARQYLEIAEAELNRVAHITRQSLGFYRESNGPATTSVTAVLESAVDLLKSRIFAKRAVIEKQWDGEVKAIAVAGELRQIFSNLLANSLDAIDEKGTIKLRVSTGEISSHGRPYIRVTVADNGKGISVSSRSHIFEPFFTTKGTVGTGLGLWVSKQIVDKHGGTIRMRSSSIGAHKGTVFSVILPAEPVAAVRSQSAGA